MKQKKVHDEVLELYLVNGSNEKKQSTKTRYMSTLKFGSSVRNLAETGDICLEGIYFCHTCFFVLLVQHWKKWIYYLF